MDPARLRPVFEESGPYLTLHVDVGRTDEHGTDRLESRWTTIRHRLDRADVPSTLVEQLADVLHENTHLPGEVRRTLVAAGGGIVFDALQAGHNPHPEVVEIGELPDLASWVDVEDQAVPFVLAVVDRTGGDVRTYRAGRQPPVDAETVTGRTFYVTKVAEGDWAQKQFQQTAENRWRENADLVAAAVRDAALEHRAGTVLVAGEVRARAEVVAAIERLDHGLDGVTEVESGGRAAGASEDALWDDVQQRLREVVATGDTDIAAALEQGRGRGRGVATGLDEVLDALVRGRVEELAVDLEALARTSVVPARHEGLPLLESATTAEELPADRVLVAAAALTGPAIHVLPASLARGGGVSAVLRWDDGVERRP